MRASPETSELETFVRAVEAGSISRAARELGVPRPTVGRRLARLEQKLGVRLLRRTTRAMALTDAGDALYARARVVLAAVRDVEAAVRQGDGAVRGLLRVSAPPIPFASFTRMVTDFTERHPDVRLELDLTTRHVDLVAEGYDVAIRGAQTLPPGLVARSLLRARLVAVASPAYLAARGTPRRVTDLARHACLVGFARGEHPVTHWPLLRGGQVRVEAAFACNEPAVLREAALRGRGIALLPATAVLDDIAQGALTAVLPERLGAESRLAVVYPEREFVPAAVRAFVDAVIAWAKTEPAISRPLPPCPAAKAGVSRPRAAAAPRRRARSPG